MDIRDTNSVAEPEADTLFPTADGETADAAAIPADPTRPKLWTIGTIVYTRGALAALFGWLLWGDFAWQLRDRVVGPVAQLLLKHLHAPDKVVGLLVGSIPSAMGLFLGPVVSTLSDNYRSRWGRRLPFLLAPTPFATAALLGLAFTQVIGRGLRELPGLHFLTPESASVVVFACLWTIFEVAAITTAGIFYALVNDVVPHELVGRSFGAFRAVSLLAGILFNYFVIGHAEQHFTAIFISVGIVYGLGLTLMCLKVREGDYPEPEPIVRRTRRDWLGPAAGYFKATFSKPYYRWIYIATTLAMVAPGPVNSFSVFYAKSVGMSTGLYGKYLALTYVISFCAAFVLGWLADRFHPLRLTIISTALYAVVTLLGGLFARTPATFAVAFVAHGVVSGALFTAIVPTYQRLFPKPRFGEFYSAANLLQGLIFVILPFSVGTMLDASGHVYRYTFVVSAFLAVLGVIGLLGVYRQFQAHGGPKGYRAPE